MLNQPRIHFNRSDSGAFVVCAVDQQPIGVDIEQILPVDMAMADIVFTDLEKDHLYAAVTEQHRLARFYTLWTLKESYLKALGKGLYVNPIDISIVADGGRYYLSQTAEAAGYCYEIIHLDERYKCAVCRKGRGDSAVRIFSLNEFCAQVCARCPSHCDSTGRLPDGKEINLR